MTIQASPNAGFKCSLGEESVPLPVMLMAFFHWLLSNGKGKSSFFFFFRIYTHSLMHMWPVHGMCVESRPLTPPCVLSKARKSWNLAVIFMDDHINDLSHFSTCIMGKIVPGV
jgi:hypothetical protein